MIGGMLFIFLLIPESPWWLASKEKLDKASKILTRFNGHVPGYNVQEVIVSLSIDIAVSANFLMLRLTTV